VYYIRAVHERRSRLKRETGVGLIKRCIYVVGTRETEEGETKQSFNKSCVSLCVCVCVFVRAQKARAE